MASFSQTDRQTHRQIDRQIDRQTGREGEEDEKNKKTGQNFGVMERKKERHRQTDKHRVHIICLHAPF